MCAKPIQARCLTGCLNRAAAPYPRNCVLLPLFSSAGDEAGAMWSVAPKRLGGSWPKIGVCGGGDIVLSLAETAGSTAFNGPGLEEKET